MGTGADYFGLPMNVVNLSQSNISPGFSGTAAMT